MNKLILVTGMVVSYGYAMEHFIAWYSGNTAEWFVFYNRATGPYRASSCEPTSVIAAIPALAAP